MKRYFIVSDIEWDTEEALLEDMEQIDEDEYGEIEEEY